jgi:hypothetical protein
MDEAGGVWHILRVGGSITFTWPRTRPHSREDVAAKES